MQADFGLSYIITIFSAILFKFGGYIYGHKSVFGIVGLILKNKMAVRAVFMSKNTIFMSDGISIWHIVVYLGQEKLICIDEFYYTLDLEMSLWNWCLKICIDQEKQNL